MDQTSFRTSTKEFSSRSLNQPCALKPHQFRVCAAWRRRLQTMGQTRLRLPPDVLQHVLGGFPGAALLCSVDVTGVTPSCTQAGEGSQMQERRSKKERWKEIQRFFPNRSPSGLEGGGCQSHEDECLRCGTRLLFAAETYTKEVRHIFSPRWQTL